MAVLVSTMEQTVLAEGRSLFTQISDVFPGIAGQVSLEIIKLFILNSAEHESFTAHKYQNTM